MLIIGVTWMAPVDGALSEWRPVDGAFSGLLPWTAR